MTKTIEQRVALTILEEPVGTITLEGHAYDIPAPTTATVIAVAGLVSTLPEFDTQVPDDRLAAEVLSHGGHAATLARIAATLMLGQKRIEERRTVEVTTGTRRRWSWRRLRYTEAVETRRVPEVEHLTDRILANCTTAHLRDIIVALVREAGLDDFFIITTSLRAGNRLAPTREVEKPTTASGPLS